MEQRKTISKEKLSKKKKDIYRDLSPVREASETLALSLPDDSVTISDEAWHFFHFETQDYATMERTIQLAAERVNDVYHYNWGTAHILSLDKMIQKIVDENKQKKADGSAVNKKAELTAREILEQIFITSGIDDNEPVFLYSTSMDISSVGGSGHSDNSVSKLSQNKQRYEVMEAFALYCAKERSLKIGTQNSEHREALDHMPVRRYNRLFFVSYGTNCILPDNLRGALCTISYPALKEEDFESLLWEYHLRKEYQEQREGEYSLDQKREILDLAPGLFQWYANRMSGLEEFTVRRLLAALATLGEDNDDRDTVEKFIVRYKNKILEQHGRLLLVEVSTNESSRNQDQVKGLDAIREWLQLHKNAIVSCDGSPVPSGILLVGIPGTGKSATAKQAAIQLKLPLVRLEMDRILGGRVGDSEKGMREMLEDLRFASPCVLWIDEIEKAMSGASGKEEGGGTIRRLFGMLLTFIQENDRPVFMVTTANDISKLPPEFFRNGRFNQTFSLLMPSYAECRDIMQLKLNQYMKALYGGADEFSEYEAGTILDACLGEPTNPRFLTGADIEAHVQELYWYCKRNENRLRYLTDRKELIKELKARMKVISENVHAQGSPAAHQTMEEIARHYLNMLMKDMKPAGQPDTVYTRANLRLDRVRFFEYDSKNHTPDKVPLCLDLPANKEKNWKKFEDPKGITCTPAEWYDARFFYEMVPVMSEVIIMDEKLTMNETRQHYWKLQSAPQKEKQDREKLYDN